MPSKVNNAKEKARKEFNEQSFFLFTTKILSGAGFL